MNVKSRIKNKRDLVANWEENNPILLDGELIIVEALNGELRFKIGDGVTNYIDLPFMDQPLRDFVENNGIEAHNTSPTAHENMGWVNTEEGSLGEVEDFGVNADTLGGIPAGNYALKTDLTGFVSSDDLANYVTLETFNSTIGDINSLLDQINGEVIN